MYNLSINESSIKDKDIFLSIDIALNKTGFVILSRNTTILLARVIKVKQHWEYYRKIAYLYNYFSILFGEILKCSPQSSTLLLEGRLKAGFSGNTLASIEGARVSTYLAYYHTCLQHEIDVQFSMYGPQLIKKHFTGKGNANKEQMHKSFISQFSSYSDLEYQEDIFDALYLGIYHLEKHPGKAP